MPGAIATLIAQDTGTTMKKTSDENGDFAFTFVPGGTYTLRIEATGFRPYAATCRRLIEFEWYQRRWGGGYQLSSDHTADGC